MEYYYDNILSSEQKELYRDCFYPWFKEGITNSCDEKTFEIKIHNLEPEDINESVNAVMRDHPELICLRPIKKNRSLYKFSLEYDGKMMNIRFFDIDHGLSYAYSEIEKKNIEVETERLINNVVSSVKKFKDDYTRIIFIADYFIKNYSYLENVSAHSSEGMIKGKIVCEGIAYSFKRICDQLGIWCIIVGGKAGKIDKKVEWEPHAWNIVKLNGNYYHMDITWAMTSSDYRSHSMNIGGMTHGELTRINLHDYTLMTDNDIQLTHIMDYEYPKCTDATMEYYRKNKWILHLNEDKNSCIETEDQLIEQMRYIDTSISKVYILRTRLLNTNGTFPKDNEIERNITFGFIRNFLQISSRDIFAASYDPGQGNYCLLFVKR